ncbi:hypothetical protein ODI84_17660 [Pseudomonas putida]|uniref:hypothetical protein n=1 Tax=Pseudomonas putida TaxID=303 RepID=UPI002D1E746C|nr:hypothetical protein [Pseudomonas putida]MEB3901999.1 hypothetical protein [Pseudomonas putida]
MDSFARSCLYAALLAGTVVLHGCSSWKPAGAYGIESAVRDSEVSALPKSQAQAVVFIDPSQLGTAIDKSAEGFAGSACEVSFRLYPELYAQSFQKLSMVYRRVDLKPLGSSAAGYDLAVLPQLEDVQWSADGPSANMAAVKVLFTLMAGGTPKHSFEAFQMARGDLGRWHQGCPDATKSSSKAAQEAVGLAVNRIVREMAAQPIRAGGASIPPSGEQQSLLLMQIQGLRGNAGVLNHETDYTPVIAAGLDVTAAAYNLKGRSAEATTALNLANQLRAGASAATGEGAAMAAVAASDGIPVPAAASSASCSGDYSFLAPQLRAYQDPSLSEVRSSYLRQPISNNVEFLRGKGLDKQSAINVMLQNAALDEQTAREAAQQARDSDGHGDVSIPQAQSDQLRLDFPCDQASIHASGVCTYIRHRWTSLYERTTAELIERCWN